MFNIYGYGSNYGQYVALIASGFKSAEQAVRFKKACEEKDIIEYDSFYTLFVGEEIDDPDLKKESEFAVKKGFKEFKEEFLKKDEEKND